MGWVGGFSVIVFPCFRNRPKKLLRQLPQPLLFTISEFLDFEGQFSKLPLFFIGPRRPDEEGPGEGGGEGGGGRPHGKMEEEEP